MRQLLKQFKSLVHAVHAARSIPRDIEKARWLARRKRQVAAYLAGSGQPRLQIGCGPNAMDGWLNADLKPRDASQVFLDATRPFPFPDACFEVVFTEHVIEHMVFDHGQNLLREALRCLKPGGIIRVSTPNLRNICGLMELEADEDTRAIRRQYMEISAKKYLAPEHPTNPSFLLNHFFWDFDHYFLYSPETLRYAMERAGFTDVRAVVSGSSEHPLLQGVEHHGEVVGAEVDQFETMIHEARKP